MVTLAREDEVFVLDLGADDNILSLESMRLISNALDTVAQFGGPATLMTIGHGKTWTNGFELEVMASRESHDDDVKEIVESLELVIARLLRLPVMSLASIQGHCFGAGAIFAMAHDVRLMRADRGYFCLPEVDLSVPFTVGISALLQMKLPSATAFEAMLTGRRYGGAEALKAGIVDDALPIEELHESAFARAKSLAPLAGTSLQGIRGTLCRQVLDALES